MQNGNNISNSCRKGLNFNFDSVVDTPDVFTSNPSVRTQKPNSLHLKVDQKIDLLIHPESLDYQTPLQFFCDVTKEKKQEPFIACAIYENFELTEPIDKPQKIRLLNSALKTDLILFTDEVNLYTEKTYQEFIQEKRNEKLPCFLATWTNPFLKMTITYDAIQFLNRYRENQLKPLKGQCYPFAPPIESFSIYKSCEKENVFKFFCNEKTLKANNGENEKRINASHTSKNIEADSLDMLGEESFFVATYYETKAVNQVLNQPKSEKNFEKAEFWLKRAANLNNPDAMWRLGRWCFQKSERTGIEEYFHEGLQYVEKSIRSMTLHHKNLKKSIDCYLEIARKLPSADEKMMKYCEEKLLEISNLL